MQRTRRMALLAVLALAGGLVLAGCRSEPKVAAYVGGTRYTVADVSAMTSRINKVNAEREASAAAAKSREELAAVPRQVPVGGDLVLGLMVYGDVAGRL